MIDQDAAITAGQQSAGVDINELLETANATVRDLLANCPVDDPLQDRLRDMQRTVQRLTLLTGGADLPTHVRHLARAPLDLNAVVREMTAPLQRLLGPFIALDVSVHEPGVWAAIERSQIEQLTLGLVINARESLPLGGAVRVSTSRKITTDEVHYRVGALPAGDWAMIEVRDNGASVDERSMRHLLDPAARGPAFDSSLSLSTVAGVVHAAGGKMLLDLPNDGGTVLAACLPAVVPRRMRRPATGTASAVLIVDDDEWTRTSAARTLRRAGFGVLEAAVPGDALELLADVAGSCVRVLIVDAAVLAGSGSALGNLIARERGEIGVILTASHRASARSADLGPTLTRPIAPDELLRVVRERLLELH